MKSIIQYVRQLYVNDILTDSKLFLKYTSCEFTTLVILSYLKNYKLINTPITFDFTKEKIFSPESFILEVILFRRSHTFLIVKDKTRTYMVSSYLDKYRSHIDELDDDLNTLLQKIYKIEFEDDIDLHTKLFKVKKVPCLTLCKSLSRIKFNLYNINL